MILKSAVDKFLARERKDFRRWQELKPEEIQYWADQLPGKLPPLWKTMRHHQRVCFVIGARKKKFFFSNDTGTGKTMLATALGQYFMDLGLTKRVMVMVPRRTNKDDWVLEFQKHAPYERVHTLEGSVADKWDQLETVDADWFIDGFQSWAHICSEKRLTKKGGAVRLKPVKARVHRLRQLFQMGIADESVILGDRSNIIWRVVNAMQFKVLFAMTATPFGRDPEPLHPQLFLIDGGYTLGETKELFKAAFWKQPKPRKGRKRKKLEWWEKKEIVFDKTKEPLLNRVLAHSSIRYEADQATLPKVLPVPKIFTLPEGPAAYYRKARKRLFAARGNVREIENAFLLMRQISSGFIGYADDVTGAKAQFAFDDNPKLEYLLDYVDQIDASGKKCIVFYEYTYSGERIARELRDMGIKVAHLYGRTKDVKSERLRFNNDPNCTVLVLQNTFGIGLNLQQAQYAIFFESPLSPRDRKQCERRVVRQESAHKHVFVVDLMMKDTVDEQIRNWHEEGNNLLQAILRGKARPV